MVMSALERLEKFEPKEFIAPILSADRTKVVVIQENLPMVVSVESEPGWYLIMPSGRVVRDAFPDEIESFIGMLPRFVVMAADHISRDIVVCVPYNISDANQRGWADGAPMQMHLVCGTIPRVMPVVARMIPGAMLFERFYNPYEQPSVRVDVISGNKGPRQWMTAMSICRANDERIAKLAREAARAERLATEQGRVEDYIDSSARLMGAEINEWNTDGGYLEVTWTFKGHTHTAEFRKNGMMVSPGICSAGTAPQHDLASAMQYIQEARVRRRFDLDQSAWI